MSNVPEERAWNFFFFLVTKVFSIGLSNDWLIEMLHPIFLGHLPKRARSVWVSVYVRVCVCIWMYVCMCVYMKVCVYVSGSVCVCVCGEWAGAGAVPGKSPCADPGPALLGPQRLLGIRGPDLLQHLLMFLGKKVRSRLWSQRRTDRDKRELFGGWG